MLTLALSMMVFQVANQWTEVSGGEDGVIVSLPPIEVAGITINILDVVTKYYLTLGLLVISMFIIWRVVHSPYGALLIAIRENPQRAKLIGVPVNRYQLSSFIIAGVFSGVAGVLFAVHNFLVTPGLLHWSTSAEPILMTLLGGPSSFFGPLLGAFLFIFLEQALTTITDFWQIGLGLILIPIVLFVPGGVASLLNSARERARSALEDRQEYDRATETKEKQD
jgi:branched-chain amino acid transport system permease protein